MSESIQTDKISIDRPFTARTFTRLYEAGLMTLGAVAACSARELLKLDGFGKKSLREVEEVLGAFGLTLASKDSGFHSIDSEQKRQIAQLQRHIYILQRALIIAGGQDALTAANEVIELCLK